MLRSLLIAMGDMDRSTPNQRFVIGLLLLVGLMLACMVPVR